MHWPCFWPVAFCRRNSAARMRRLVPAMVFMPGPMLCHLPPVGKPRRPRYKFVSGTAVLCLSGTMMGAILALARISHTGRCIGVLILRKSCCDNGLSQDQGSPDADRV